MDQVTSAEQSARGAVPQARRRMSMEMEPAQVSWAVSSLLATGSSAVDAVDEWWD